MEILIEHLALSCFGFPQKEYFGSEQTATASCSVHTDWSTITSVFGVDTKAVREFNLVNEVNCVWAF